MTTFSPVEDSLYLKLFISSIFIYNFIVVANKFKIVKWVDSIIHLYIIIIVELLLQKRMPVKVYDESREQSV